MADQKTMQSPEQVMAMLQGFMGSAALKAGLDLEVFTHITKGNDTAEKLAAAKGVTPRAIRILCDALTAFGVLQKSDGHYSVPPVAQMLLVKGSPAYLGAMSRITASKMIWDEASRLTDIVKAGHSLAPAHAETPDNPFWQEFSRGSRQMATMAGPGVAEVAAAMFPNGAPKRILDIAAGSGIYGFSALKRFPQATLVSVDWPTVLKLAEPTAKQMGLSDRVEFRPGDIFSDDLGAGYDLVLAVNIYHHFNIDKCIALSRRLYDATAPGGVLVVVDAVPDEKREEDRFGLTFALTMLIWTHEGDTYTLSQYQRMLRAAGYHDIELRSLPGPTPQQAVIARK
jgi:SAM-dependent methyltransferase